MQNRSSRQQKVAILAGLLAAASSVGWQSAQSGSSQLTSKDTPLSFSSKVYLVSVPVVVRDSHGGAVGGLTKDDFQLLDSGKPQLVSGFSVESYGSSDTPGTSSATGTDSASGAPASASQPPALLPQRFVALVVDDLHTEFADLVWVRKAAEKFLASVPSTERVALYTTSGLVGVDFTSDRDQLLKQLRSIRSLVLQPAECLQISYFIAEQLRKEACLPHEFRLVKCPTKNALAREAAECSGVEVEQLGGKIHAAAERALAEGDQNIRKAMNTIRAVIGKLATAPGQRQIVLLSDGFLVTDDHRYDETILFNEAIRARVMISSLDARGVKAFVPGGSASERGSRTADAMMLKVQYAAMEGMAMAGVMDEVANATGGRFVHGNNDMELGLSRLAGVPEHRYVLAFSPQDLKYDGKYHPLKVSLRKGKGLSVEARRGYYAPNHRLSPEEETKEEIKSAFFSTDEVHDLPASLVTQYVKSGANEATINSTVTLDVRQLKYKQEAGLNRNDVTVVYGLFDQDGNFVSGIQKVLEMRFRDETLATGLANGLAVTASMKTTPGKYVMRMVVRDSEGKTLTALARPVDIP